MLQNGTPNAGTIHSDWCRRRAALLESAGRHDKYGRPEADEQLPAEEEAKALA